MTKGVAAVLISVTVAPLFKEIVPPVRLTPVPEPVTSNVVPAGTTTVEVSAIVPAPPAVHMTSPPVAASAAKLPAPLGLVLTT
jgi:hypothetical protein